MNCVYTYFIVYNFKTKFDFGWGNKSMESYHPIESLGDIREIEKLLKTEQKIKELLITNWKLLSKSPLPLSGPTQSSPKDKQS